MKKIRMGVAAVGVLAAMTLSACSSGTDSADGNSTNSPDQLTIGMVVKTESNPVFQGMIKGATDAAAAEGVTLRTAGGASESDITGQINKIQDLISQGVDVLLVAPNGDSQLQPVLQSAVDAGIPVIMIDENANFEARSSYVHSDQKDGSTQVNQYLVDQLGADAKGAQVGLLDYPGVKSVDDRLQAAKAVFEKAGMEIVSTLPGNCDRAQAQTSATDMLTAHPEIKAIFGGCGQGATGAAQAVQNAGLDVLVTGFDGINDEFKDIQDGTMLGTILQDFPAIGKQALEAGIAAARGEQVDPEYLIPGILVTKDNVADYNTAG